MVKKYFQRKYVVSVIILLALFIFVYRNWESQRRFENAYELIYGREIQDMVNDSGWYNPH